MTYKELFDKLPPWQLNEEIVVFKGDEETGTPIYTDTQGEDFYWMDGDCYGDLKSVNEFLVSNKKGFPNDDLQIEDFTLIPKGTLFIHLDED